MNGPIDRIVWAEVLRWLAYVDQDIRVIEIAMAEPSPIFGPAAFHCQQAAEKMAKALLVARGAEFAPTSDDVRMILPRLKQVRAYIDSLAPKA